MYIYQNIKVHNVFLYLNKNLKTTLKIIKIMIQLFMVLNS